MAIVILSLASFKNRTKNEIVYIIFKAPQLEVKYLKEGILISGIYKSKYRVCFIRTKQLDLNKLKLLDNFIERNNIWSMDSIYRGNNKILGTTSRSFILISSSIEQYKKIEYYDCYNPTLDSLIICLNDLIPKHNRKQFDMEKYRFKKNIYNECK